MILFTTVCACFTASFLACTMARFATAVAGNSRLFTPSLRPFWFCGRPFVSLRMAEGSKFRWESGLLALVVFNGGSLEMSERPIWSMSSREMFDTCKSLHLSLFERQEATIWSRVMLSVCVSNFHVLSFVVGCTMSQFPCLVLEHNGGIRIARKQRCFEMKNIA